MINHTDINYSDTFKNTITNSYGAKGSEWLASLPALIEQCAMQWHLTELRTYPELSYNYVMAGMMRDTPIVLKLRCNPVELEKEIAALNAYNGYGCVKVLAYNLSLGAMVLERAIPGEPLSHFFSHEDEQATHIAARCMQSLHKASIPKNHSFLNLEQTLPHFKKTSTALDHFIERAEELKKNLLATQQKAVLLHGDFHAGNILSCADNQWIVIDPAALIGDPIYDLAVYIRNPLTELITTPGASLIIRNRIDTFARILGFSRERIYHWTYVQAVSSAYWSIEDGLDITRHIAFLQLLESA